MMSPQLLSIVIYVLLFVGTLVLIHYGLVPESALQIILSLLAGHAAGTDTLIPQIRKTGVLQSAPSTEKPEKTIQIQKPFQSTFTSLPDSTQFPTVSLPAMPSTVRKQTKIIVPDPGTRG